jgi:hypothetical protein
VVNGRKRPVFGFIILDTFHRISLLPFNSISNKSWAKESGEKMPK